MKTVKYFSLFSGIGGFDLALNRLGHTCVGYSEIDKYAIQTYEKNFGMEVKNYGNAKRIDTDELPDFDMLCGGFPCQAFSIAGKRRGFNDTRGTLFFEIARILEAKRPSIVLLENVKGLLNHARGQTFKVILQTLGELGYSIEWMVLNSKFFGVPQNRERVFIIGHLRRTGEQQVLPLGETGSEHVKELRYEGAIMSEQNKKWLEDGKKLSRNFPQGQRVYSTGGIASSICGDAGGLGGKTGLYMVGSIEQKCIKRKYDAPKEINQFLKENKNKMSLKEIAKELSLPKTQVEHYFRTDKSRAIPSPKVWFLLKELLGFDSTYDREVTDTYQKMIEFEQTRRVYDSKGLSPTVNSTSEPMIAQALQTDGQLRQGTSWNTDKPQSSRNIRRLTPVECERLQGFPDRWSEGVSDTQRYKQCGNAVTVNVVYELCKKILNEKEERTFFVRKHWKDDAKEISSYF